MNMLVRIITFLVLCELCASQSPDLGGSSKYCDLVQLAKHEVDHYVIISNDIDTNSSMLTELYDLTSTVADTPKKLITRVKDEYLNTVVDDQASWKDSLNYLTHTTQLINDNSIPYCGEVKSIIKDMRKQNYSMERVVYWVSGLYNKLYACVITSDNTVNCSYSDQTKYVLKDIDGNSHENAVTKFREKYPELLTKYNKNRHLFISFHSMILWFRTLKLTNTNFDEATTKWLSDGFEKIEGALLNTKYQIGNVHKDIKKIGKFMKRVNGRKSEFVTLQEYLPTIKSRVQQMDQVSSFLDSKVEEMKTYSALIQDQNFSDIAIWADVQDETDGQNQDENEIPSAFTLREDVVSILSSTVSLRARAAAKSLTDINTDYDHADNSLVTVFKSLDAMYTKFSVDLASSLQCDKETSDAMRYVALMKIRLFEKNITDEDLGAIFDDVKQNYEDFVTAANAFFTELNDNVNDFKADIDSMNNLVFEVSETRSAEDMTTFTSLLTQLSETFKAFFDIQCKTHQSAFYSELVLKYDNGSLLHMFNRDGLVKEVLEREGGVSLQEFMTSMNDYYTSTKIETFYQTFDELIDIFDDAYEAFNHSNPNRDRATEMSALVVRLTTQKDGLADMTTNGNRFYMVATHTGLVTMIVLSEHFECPNINEYGDFRESTESPLLTRNVTTKTEAQIEGDLFGDILDDPIRLQAINNDSSIATRYLTEPNQFTVHKLGASNAVLFTTPSCLNDCTYTLNLKPNRESKVAVAVGCYNDGTGVFSEIRDYVTGGKSSVFITQNDPSGTVDIVYLDEYNRIYSSHHTFHKRCVINFAFSGAITFTYAEVTAAIVDIPSNVSQSARYNVFNARTASGFEKKIYVSKGVYLGDQARWLTLKLTPVELKKGACHGFGVVREFMNEFGKVELKGILYDGNNIVFNPDSVCLYGATKSDNLDLEVDNDDHADADDVDDEQDEVLYMYYQAEQIGRSHQFNITVKLFSNKKAKGFMFERVEDFKYAPSYVTLKPADQVIDFAEPTPLENEPEDMPVFKNVCTYDDNPCTTDQYCHYSTRCNVPNGTTCRTIKEHKFASCRHNKLQETPSEMH